MAARIFASLLVLGSSAFLLTNCGSSDGGSGTPAAGSPSVAGAGNNSAGAPAAAGNNSAGAPAGGGGSSSVGGGGSAGTPAAGAPGMAGSGGSSAGASQGGSAGASGGAGGAATGGGSSAGSGGQGGATGFALTSSKLAPGMTFPTEFTCGGTDNHSPPFAWTAGPSGTLSYALVLYDPDAKFYHWAVWDIPPATNMLAESLQKTGTISTPAGAKQSGTGYSGPCPPGNAVHTYVFTLYALDVATLPGVTTSTSAANVNTAIQMHDLASATLTAPSNGK